MTMKARVFHPAVSVYVRPRYSIDVSHPCRSSLLGRSVRCSRNFLAARICTFAAFRLLATRAARTFRCSWKLLRDFLVGLYSQHTLSTFLICSSFLSRRRLPPSLLNARPLKCILAFRDPADQIFPTVLSNSNHDVSIHSSFNRNLYCLEVSKHTRISRTSRFALSAWAYVIGLTWRKKKHVFSFIQVRYQSHPSRMRREPENIDHNYHRH